MANATVLRLPCVGGGGGTFNPVMLSIAQQHPRSLLAVRPPDAASAPCLPPPPPPTCPQHVVWALCLPEPMYVPMGYAAQVYIYIYILTGTLYYRACDIGRLYTRPLPPGSMARAPQPAPLPASTSPHPSPPPLAHPCSPHARAASHPCVNTTALWAGVICNMSGSVVGLHLAGLGLAAPATNPAAAAVALRWLRYLSLSGMWLFSPPPAELAALTDLTKLDLSNCSLSGQ